jgi:hypothetical protein
VRATIVQAIREILWQERGQPLDGMEQLQREAELAADEALGVIAAADLFHSDGERLAATLTAAENCREEVLRMRERRR